MAQQAYTDLEYERAQRFAVQAIESGQLDRDEAGRAYQLLGTASAYRDDQDQAYEAYRLMLGIRPDARMDESLAPEQRTPFLRARGWWASQPGRLELTVALGDPGGSSPLQLELSLTDPGGDLRRVALHVRAAGEDDYRRLEVEPTSQLRISLGELGLPAGASERADSFEVYARAMDRHGNEIVRLGTASVPERLDNPRAARRRVAADGLEEGGGSVLEEWWFWTIVGVVVAGGITAAVLLTAPPNYQGSTSIRF